METENTQQNMSTDDLSVEETAASLGLSTRLSEQFLMSQAQPQAPQTPQDGTGQEIEPEHEEMAEEDLEAKIEEKVAQAVKEEMAGLKEELAKALNE